MKTLLFGLEITVADGSEPDADTIQEILLRGLEDLYAVNVVNAFVFEPRKSKTECPNCHKVFKVEYFDESVEGNSVREYFRCPYCFQRFADIYLLAKELVLCE